MPLPTLAQFATGEFIEGTKKTNSRQRAKIERCVKARKSRTGRKKPSSSDFAICTAAVKKKKRKK